MGAGAKAAPTLRAVRWCLVFSPWLFAGRNCGRKKPRRKHQAGRRARPRAQGRGRLWVDCGRIVGGLRGGFAGGTAQHGQNTHNLVVLMLNCWQFTKLDIRRIMCLLSVLCCEGWIVVGLREDCGRIVGGLCAVGRCLVFSPWLFAGRNCGREKRRRKYQAGRSREACGRIAGGSCGVGWCLAFSPWLFAGRNCAREKRRRNHQAGRSRAACRRIAGGLCGVGFIAG